MSSAATPAEPTQAPNPAADDHEFAQTIRTLIAAGETLTLQLVTEPVPASMKAEPYERFTRSIRKSILLARHLRENPVSTAATRRTIARKYIVRRVEDAIHRVQTESEAAESLRAELLERLEQPELEDDIANCPIDDVIRDIRRDLGLDNVPRSTWPRRTPEDITDLAARAAAPSRPAPPPDPDPEHPAQAEPGLPAPASGPPLPILPRTFPKFVRDG